MTDAPLAPSQRKCLESPQGVPHLPPFVETIRAWESRHRAAKKGGAEALARPPKVPETDPETPTAPPPAPVAAAARPRRGEAPAKRGD